MILVIDPGLKKAGIAIFSDSGTLLEARLVSFHSSGGGPMVWRRMAYAVSGALGFVPSKIVHEIMVVRSAQTYAAQDLIEVTGALSWTLAVCSGPETEIVPLSVNEWKGNLPKEVTKRRAGKVLSAAELEGFENWNHDVWDAVAIGLYYFGR